MQLRESRSGEIFGKLSRFPRIEIFYPTLSSIPRKDLELRKVESKDAILREMSHFVSSRYFKLIICSFNNQLSLETVSSSENY